MFIALVMVGPGPVIRHAPSSGSTKIRLTKSVPSLRGSGRVRLGEYVTCPLTWDAMSYGARSLVNHHTVLVILIAELAGTHTSYARLWFKAGPR